MTIRIDTVEQWNAYRSSPPPPITITSRTRGAILVPCAHVLLINPVLVAANTYNPNSVAPDRMDLLVQSIMDNGFCFPIVTIWDEDLNSFVIVDGFHRATILGPEWLDCDYIPLVVLTHDMSQRLAATWAFNKAKGSHQVDLDAELIRKMLDQGLSDEEVASKLGIDLDTVHRYKQVTGVAALFAGHNYSSAWEMEDE